MPRLVLNDGYTLHFSTEEKLVEPITGRVLAEGLPVVMGRLRPALPTALSEWRYALRTAASGKDEVAATAKLLADHICDWDVTDSQGKTLPPTAENIRRVPEPILDQLVRKVTSWAGPEQEKVAGN